MEVGFDRERNIEPGAIGGGKVASGVPGGVDDKAPSFAKVDEVRRVPEAVIDDRKNVIGAVNSHAGFVADTTM
jgi:hypothetical protein